MANPKKILLVDDDADLREALAEQLVSTEDFDVFEAGDGHEAIEKVKQAIVAASELDTRLVMRPLRNTERVLTNPAVERLLQKEKALGAALKFEDIAAEVAGVYPRIMQGGDLDAGAWSCGMVAGLIHDVPTVKELIDRVMAEAESIITRRLAGMQSA